ncbi:MAG: DEAD/DEAH box helicase, partial [Myxococcales bacterium]|nr:DEAD/DEAH box helicase [Myxococcales bacterium]
GDKRQPVSGMDQNEQAQAERVLQKVPAHKWQAFFDSGDGESLREQDDIAYQTLRASGQARSGARGKPVEVVLDLLGDRLLSNRKAGAEIRRLILESMPPTHWRKLFARYDVEAGARAAPSHGNMSQHGAGSRVMSEYWHQGGTWARSFCELSGLPQCLAEHRRNVLPADEDVASVEALPALHDFQLDVYAKLRKRLGNGSGSAAMLSLPTGAGKTRVAVEGILDHLAESTGRRNLVVWIAQSEELQRQAWECFRQAWQTPPKRESGHPIPRPGILRVVRAWGARRADDVEIGPERTVLIAGIQQLASWTDKSPQFFDAFPFSRIAAVVIDEAHRVLAPQHRDVLVALRLRAARQWRPLSGSAPVIGLTATPWRTLAKEDAPLRSYFQHELLTPRALGKSPIQELQRRKILARVKSEKLIVSDAPQMSLSQQARYERFRELPTDFLQTLGRSPQRNGAIVRRLLALPKRARVLLFACSVEHAAILTVALNRALPGKAAALITGNTPRSERYDVLQAFRSGKVRFLCNVGVLTTGFDAPKVDVVCLTRPTASALLYEQMVGRGLRGPKNGGTTSCRVLDVQDDGLPEGIMSYARVLEEWRA